MKLRYSQHGEVFPTSPSCDVREFPHSQTLPDQSLTIREIYDRWTKGKPTTVHPLSTEYDPDDYDPDYLDEVIDRSQVHNLVEDTQNAYKAEVERVKTARKVREQSSKGIDPTKVEISNPL